MNYTQDTINLWFPDQKEPVYDPNDFVSQYQFKEYWRKEKDRCINGFDLANGKVHISGHLYFHTVYWKIAMYLESTLPNGKKKKIRDIKTPYLRDTEWEIINEDFVRADGEGRFYNLVGSRDFGKSIIAASRAGWQYTFFDNSESVISGGADNYIKLVTDKIEDGLTNLHPALKKNRIANDWKREVKAGWKDKKTNQPDPRSSNSRILMRNYENGNKSMAANGTRPGFHLIDEEGTIQHLIACIKDSDGCWWSGGGNKPSCLVMITGTGGDMEVGAEAGEIFFNPTAYNMLEFEDEWEGRGKIGRFIPATKARMGFKEPVSLSTYLGVEHPDLEKITILVSNEERCLKEWWEPEYAKALKSGNAKTITKFLAYWPLKPSDSFLVIAKNDFNTQAAKAQQFRIREGIYNTLTPIELFHDGEKICHKFSDKRFITEFPVKTENADAPIAILEFPMENPPHGLYVGGVDPYRQDEAEYSDSLGSIYILKRIHDITSEKYYDILVAWYTARPNRQSDWEEQARLLIKYYNAVALVENDEKSFINYMINKGDGHYLADTPQWLRELGNSSTLNRSKGISTAPKSHKGFILSTLKKYLDDPILTEKDDNGSIIKEIMGVAKIMDPMLLEEIIKFNRDKGNYDRIIAAALAVTQARKMDPLYHISSTEADPRLKSYFNTKRNKRPMFNSRNSAFKQVRIFK